MIDPTIGYRNKVRAAFLNDVSIAKTAAKKDAEIAAAYATRNKNLIALVIAVVFMAAIMVLIGYFVK